MIFILREKTQLTTGFFCIERVLMIDVSVADLTLFSHAFGSPEIKGVYKVLPEDFVVEEQIAFELSGEGEHLWCWVEKTGENTDWVLQQLAKWANVPSSKVGVAGQKDRHAVTRQWFSIHLPRRADPCPSDFKIDRVSILKTVRHHRKLQTGGLSGNRFTLIIRDLHEENGTEDIVARLQARLQRIKSEGVPNYFGAQRFGMYGRNIKQGIKLLAGELPKVKRNQKSMYLSSIRSWMFNVLLSHRVANGSWNQLLLGDVLQLQGSNKWFLDDGSLDLKKRVEELDIHPTGALYGKGMLPTQQEALRLERAVANEFFQWIQGLEDYGVQQDRRALRVLPLGLEWRWLDDEETGDALAKVSRVFSPQEEGALWMNRPALQLSFTLRSGSYATMVLRELCWASDYQENLKKQKISQ